MVLSFLKVDLSNYVKEANKYGNVIENIIEDEQDSSLLEVWKRERRLKIIYGGNVCGFNHFLINAMYGEVEREKLVQDLINYHAQNVIPLVLQQLAIVNQLKDGNSRRQRKKELVLERERHKDCLALFPVAAPSAFVLESCLVMSRMGMFQLPLQFLVGRMAIYG